MNEVELPDLDSGISKWVSENKLVVFMAGMGGLMALIGIKGFWSGLEPESKVEVLVADEEEVDLVVYVSGAVMRPGVYEVASGSRVGDLIELAGGVVEEMVDMNHVSKVMNLALPLSDGMKVYVPFVDDENERAESGYLGSLGEDVVSSGVSVNTASVSELKTLKGIGEVRAQAIVEHRPYVSLEELVEKAGLPKSLLEENQGALVLD